jgi:peroxiredoxin
MAGEFALGGRHVPLVELASTHGDTVNLATLAGTSVIAIYPFTGRPGFPNPPGWDDIPGAHGSTPQLLGFSEAYEEFKTLNVKIFGLSSMTPEWQKDFAARNALPFALLSDEQQLFAHALHLATFKAGEVSYLTRRALIIRDGVVIHDIFPVTVPEENAAQVLKVLRA